MSGRQLRSANAATSGLLALPLQEALATAASPAICHLVLDNLVVPDSAAGLPQQPRQPSHLDGTQLRGQAAHMVLASCACQQPRLAVKVAVAYRLAAEDFTAAQQCVLLDCIAVLLDANATSACGVALLLHFAPLRTHFHLEAVLEDLVVSCQDPVALCLVQELGGDDGREMQVCATCPPHALPLPPSACCLAWPAARAAPLPRHPAACA